MNGRMLMVEIQPRTKKTGNAKITIPRVTGGTSTRAADKMNREIEALNQQLLKDQGYPSADVQELDASFEIKTNERGVLSLSLLHYVFTGGAHGTTVQKSLTFDAETGKRYTLGELFKPGSRYIDRLNKLVEAQIKARQLPLLVEFPGISPDQDFYVADKSLVLYFQLYEIVPYVWGFPYFVIPVYEIQDIVDEDGPLGIMMY